MPRMPAEIVKTYPVRGPMQQHRLAASTAFHCFRCGASKKSKLVTVFGGEWSKILCNGCYGRLLSIYEIKAGTKEDDQRAEELLQRLLSSVEAHQQREAERLLVASEQRFGLLCPQGLRFLATAEYLAAGLEAAPDLEWSPVTIGLCKAFEVEVTRLLLRPLADRCSNLDLTEDKQDREIGRVAAYCAGTSNHPPELGTFAHFLSAVIRAERPRKTSLLIDAFLQMLSERSGAQWILDPLGLHRALTTLTKQYRNRAAHIDELSQADFFRCRDLLIGKQGALWKLIVAVERH